MAADQSDQLVRASCGADDVGAPVWMLRGDDEGPPQTSWLTGVSPAFDRLGEQRRGQHDEDTIPQSRMVAGFAHVVQQRRGTQGRMIRTAGANGAQDAYAVQLIRAAHAPKDFQQGRRERFFDEQMVFWRQSGKQCVEELRRPVGDFHTLRIRCLKITSAGAPTTRSNRSKPVAFPIRMMPMRIMGPYGRRR